MSHPAESALVHPSSAALADYHPHPPKRKKPLASDLLIAEKAKKPAIFTLDNLRRDALAGSITGLLAVPLTVGICLMSEYPIETGLMTVIFACLVSFVTFLFKPGNYVGTPGVAAGLAPVLALEHSQVRHGEHALPHLPHLAFAGHRVEVQSPALHPQGHPQLSSSKACWQASGSRSRSNSCPTPTASCMRPTATSG
jgi:hypothetical protein